jgi:hypothetical protein
MAPSEGEHRDEQEREEFAKHADEEPHHALNNPVDAPDETEWPDPYEKREDPRDDAPAPAPPSTSEPHPPRNVDDERREHRGDHNDG